MRNNQEVTPWNYKQNRQDEQQKMLITAQYNCQSNLVTYQSSDIRYSQPNQYKQPHLPTHLSISIKPLVCQIKPQRQKIEMRNINISSLLQIGGGTSWQVTSTKKQYQKMLVKQMLLVYIHEQLKSQKKQQKANFLRQKLGCLFPLIEFKHKNLRSLRNKKGSINDIIRYRKL